MPWQEDDVVLKTRFVHEFNAPGANKSEVCRKYGVSRDTGYETVKRYHRMGEVGLTPASSAPHTPHNQVAVEVIERVMAIRDASPNASWSANKIIDFWGCTEIKCPSRATITRILNQYCPLRRYHRRALRNANVPAPAVADNDVWAVDGKGLWRGISPLSVLDVHSRYLLALENVPLVTTEVQRVTGRLFDERGLPRRIRCDGGPPFGGAGLAQLSRLALWWIDLGITVEHVSKPQHNGHLERLHGIFEQEAARDGDVTSALSDFRRLYNEDRPHESLGGRTPGEVYKPQEHAPHSHFVARYDDERSVRNTGYFKWKGSLVFLSEALIGRSVTFRLLDEALWLVRYRHMPLALFNERSLKLHRCPRDVFDNFT